MGANSVEMLERLSLELRAAKPKLRDFTELALARPLHEGAFAVYDAKFGKSQVSLKVILKATALQPFQLERNPLYDKANELPFHPCLFLYSFEDKDLPLQLQDELQVERTSVCHIFVLPPVGRDLKTLLEDAGDELIRERFPMAFQDIIYGTYVLNMHSVVHCNLKPETILTYELDGQVRYIIPDLGEALDARKRWKFKLGFQLPGDEAVRCPEVVKAAENHQDEPIVDWSKQDAWSVGQLLKELLAAIEDPSLRGLAEIAKGLSEKDDKKRMNLEAGNLAIAVFKCKLF